ncbi:hypothetical protein T9A_00616 [Alcanivorax jadensis T9]|jgi:hypothetical protein|uniref:DUF547 domain-containing protein n=1 Tax=Alcanivorax jadensis T9 TaxID=1177181 RepID=A0ABR4WFX9_9GAMM|nr:MULTISPECIES: DUF547 domain-containing protein [Alcanivorax]KGD62325.1 hypothetical protein T9A_00616 [Alcanivorax jadensis T9]MAC14797.1 DUF547 domain-containing protein [Alcanivorax sp.]MBP22801.1 DUF547 domain-containing protein [Alcanivorax sp.]MDF1636260.1 DUF547 domain-containing protein [Alcanivorax jadensis]|tara:strand:- start:2227 stop:3021 length:795 start_codon:yes stop_codon:yes gene_type:complete
MAARLLLPLLLLLASPLMAFDHQRWDALLDNHVQWQRGGVTTSVDYPGLRKDRAALDEYLGALSQVSKDDFESWPRDKKLAFLINAYNAFTIDLVLRQDTLPDSIRDIGSFFSGPWDQRFFTLLGEARTLDEVEHDMIRGNPALMDPRIHFAVNCASVGCPALRPEAYRAKELEQQLADSTRRFLADRQRNRFNEKPPHLAVSKIFDWYEDDFIDAAGSLSHYLLQYADTLEIPANHRKSLDAERLKIQFLDYDWSLNSETNGS